jgi:chemotaxis protein CheC
VILLEKNLSEFELDALREISNIGSGNAATVLSQLVNKKIDMTVPQVDVLPFNDMIRKIGAEDEKFVAVLLRVFGDAPGNILYLMGYKKAESVMKYMLKDYKEYNTENEELSTSVYQEIGNILGNSYLNAISKMTGLTLMTSVPAVAIDMLAAILTTSFIYAQQYDDYVLAIDTHFIDDNKDVGGSFIYIPSPGSLDKILKNLGIK